MEMQALLLIPDEMYRRDVSSLLELVDTFYSIDACRGLAPDFSVAAIGVCCEMVWDLDDLEMLARVIGEHPEVMTPENLTRLDDGADVLNVNGPGQYVNNDIGTEDVLDTASKLRAVSSVLGINLGRLIESLESEAEDQDERSGGDWDSDYDSGTLYRDDGKLSDAAIDSIFETLLPDDRDS